MKKNSIIPSNFDNYKKNNPVVTNASENHIESVNKSIVKSSDPVQQNNFSMFKQNSFQPGVSNNNATNGSSFNPSASLLNSMKSQNTDPMNTNTNTTNYNKGRLLKN